MLLRLGAITGLVALFVGIVTAFAVVELGFEASGSDPPPRQTTFAETPMQVLALLPDGNDVYSVVLATYGWSHDKEDYLWIYRFDVSSKVDTTEPLMLPAWGYPLITGTVNGTRLQYRSSEITASGAIAIHFHNGSSLHISRDDLNPGSSR